MDKPNFEIVTSSWIKGKLKEHGLSQVKLAEMINMDNVRLNKVIHGENMGNTTRAALYYFFEALGNE